MKPAVLKKAFSPKVLAKIALLLFLLRLGAIPIQSAIAQYQSPQPQAIFVLGGDRNREKVAAKIAQTNPKLPIWISSGSSPDWTKPHFQKAGISLSRLHLNYCAVDTVTNFTCLVDELRQQNIHHVYLVTSEFHLSRAQVIGFFVFGSRNIAITPIGIPSQPQSEPWVDTFRDHLRSIIWVFTGRRFLRFHPRERD